ncbi:MAG: hypothetical protein PVSMB1_03150 [Gemmatimonadaceae bacterium]
MLNSLRLMPVACALLAFAGSGEAHLALRAEGHFIAVNGARIYYETYGPALEEMSFGRTQDTCTGGRS